MHTPQWLACVRLACAVSTPFLHEPAPLHTRSLLPLGATASYSVDLHLLACVAQLRSDVALPAAFWYSPLPQTSHLVQLVRRCDEAVWNVLLAHAEQVLLTALSSTLICFPGPHVGCVAHEVLRCTLALW